MSAIFFFSTDNFSSEETGSVLRSILHSILPFLSEGGFQSLHFLIRKAGHFTEYAILALLLYRAFRYRSATHWKRSWAFSALLIVAIYALSDEYHQAFTAMRTASIYDSLIDIAGGFTALFFLWILERKS
jgi:VanZ family protein